MLLITTIDTVQSEHKKLLLVGDFNIDLLKFESHNKTNAFIDNMFSVGLSPLITKSTRVTPHSPTVIDHAYTNIQGHNKSGIIISNVADHFGIFTILNAQIKRPKYKIIDIRHFHTCSNS